MPIWALGASSRRSKQGADIVVCPRVTDASVVVGPAAWHFGWQRNDWDRLAGAVVAGHVVECGTQCTGGNYAFFQEVPGLEQPGFPIAEMHDDGSSVITKHDGTGGLVSVGTVTAQLLYEIDKPAYINPDVVARFDTIRLEQEGPDRVRISGVRGEPAPPTIKVCLNYLGGFRNQMTFVLTGLDIDEKAALVERTLRSALDAGKFDAFDIDLARTDKPDAATNQEASALLESDRQEPGRRSAWTGRFPVRSSKWPWPAIPASFARRRRREASPFGVYWPTLVPADVPQHAVVLEDGRRIPIPPTEPARAAARATCRRRGCRRSRPGPAAGAAGHAVRRPLRRQGRQCQRRRVGPRPGATPGSRRSSPSSSFASSCRKRRIWKSAATSCRT